MFKHRLAFAAFFLAGATVALVGGCPPPAPVGVTMQPGGFTPPPGAPHPQPVGIAPVVDEDNQTFQISQGAPGDPAIVGCADGQREAFVDQGASPRVAGCIGEWEGTRSLREPPTGHACGDDLGPCAVPADACAAGWHVCGASGQLAEISAIGGDACERAGGGKFVAAISHCKTQSGCEYADPKTGSYDCFKDGWCSEAFCCGSDCGTGSCPSGIFPDHTHIAIGTDQGCAAIRPSRARGILCCK